MAMLHLLEDGKLWKDFPKGLHVLVVDKNAQTLNDIKGKLEDCKYEVTAFERSEDAVSALGNPSSSFHVALVEVAIGEGLDGFNILSAKKHKNIPTIMMSEKENREVILRAFALGAVEFIQKPLSEEKLKNVWQHAVRKALAKGENTLPQSLKSLDTKPINSSISDEIAGDEEVISEDMEDPGFILEAEPHAKTPAPWTPQQELTDLLSSRENNGEDSSGSMHGVKIQSEESQYSDGGGSSSSIDENKKDILCSELQTSTESAANEDVNYFKKMEMDFDGFSLGDGDLNLSDLEIDPDMFAEFSFENHRELDMDLYSFDHCEVLEKDLAEEEALLLAEVSKAEKEQQIAIIPDNTTNSSDSSDIKDEVLSVDKKSTRAECTKIASKNHHGKRKVKVDWTPDLHRRFVQAVESLGIEKAVPSRILELMGVNCLTRHNIASHLQKYRSHRKHLLAREAEAASWNHKRQLYATPGTRSRREVSYWTANSGNTLIQPRPPIIYPPATHPPLFRPLHVWGHPTVDHSIVHMWHKQPFSPATWPAADGTFWQHQQACTDAWGHNAPAPGTPCYPQPVVRLPLAPVAGVPHFNHPVFNGDHNRPEDSSTIHRVQIDVKPATMHPPKETVDAAINEVLSNPWTPLPIGLNPPSLESVMTELQRKGISNMPLASPCLAR